jgi:hypothetical protein
MLLAARKVSCTVPIGHMASVSSVSQAKVACYAWCDAEASILEVATQTFTAIWWGGGFADTSGASQELWPCA